jgi:uncharacterized membrane protein YdfJ with MMPL/SSD domain
MSASRNLATTDHTAKVTVVADPTSPADEPTQAETAAKLLQGTHAALPDPLVAVMADDKGREDEAGALLREAFHLRIAARHGFRVEDNWERWEQRANAHLSAQRGEPDDMDALRRRLTAALPAPPVARREDEGETT